MCSPAVQVSFHANETHYCTKIFQTEAQANLVFCIVYTRFKPFGSHGHAQFQTVRILLKWNVPDECFQKNVNYQNALLHVIRSYPIKKIRY